MNLPDLLSLLRARWLVIVATTLVGGVLGMGASLLTVPTYQAQIQFFATTSTAGTGASAYQGSLGAQQKVQTYAELVNSREIAQQVLEVAGVNMEADQVAAATTATSDAKTVLLNVTVRDSRPERAMELAEAYGVVLPRAINALETPDGGGPALAKLTVTSPPVLPNAPIAPKTEQNIAIGLVLGFLSGIGLILLANALDRRLKTKDQIESITGSAIVGAIPFRKTEDKELGAEHIVPFREGHSPAAEAFRRLRTNLEFLNVDSPPRVIVMTSSVPTEGKSETAVNLAISLAEAGHRTLLVEADLRRPRVVNYLSMPDKVGLTNVLSGQAEFTDVVQETKYEGVDLLACGPLPPNPSELLASETAKRLINDLRAEYDYVIIDSPPLLPVTDGALLARIADGALLVVRSHRTTTEQVSQAVDNLKMADARLLGVVTISNKAAKKGTANYYGTYYATSKLPSGAVGD